MSPTLSPTTSPRPTHDPAVAACIDACRRCARACEECADYCFTTPGLSRLGLRLSQELEGAQVCLVTAHALAGGNDLALAHVSACAEMCEMIAAACVHDEATHPLCRACAEACRECLAACLTVINAH